MANLGGNRAYKPGANEHDAKWLSDNIGSVVGTTATLLTAPAGTTGLVLKADAGTWRVRSNDHTADMPGAVDPAATLSLGEGAWKLAAGEGLILTASEGSKFTVKGFGATDVLTYYWV